METRLFKAFIYIVCVLIAIVVSANISNSNTSLSSPVIETNSELEMIKNCIESNMKD